MPAPPTAAMEVAVLFAGSALAAISAITFVLLTGPPRPRSSEVRASATRRTYGRVRGFLAVVAAAGIAAVAASLVAPPAIPPWGLPLAVLAGALSTWGLGRIEDLARELVRRRVAEPPLDPMAPPRGDDRPAGALAGGAAVAAVVLLALGGLLLALNGATVALVGVVLGGAVGVTAQSVVRAEAAPGGSEATGEPRVSAGGAFGRRRSAEYLAAALAATVGSTVLALGEPVIRVVVPSAVIYPLSEFAAVSVGVAAVGVGWAVWSHRFGGTPGVLPILVACSVSALAVLWVASSFGDSNTAIAVCGLIGVAASGVLLTVRRTAASSTSPSTDMFGRDRRHGHELRAVLAWGSILPVSILGAYLSLGWAGRWGAIPLDPALGIYGVGVTCVAMAAFAGVATILDSAELEAAPRASAPSPLTGDRRGHSLFGVAVALGASLVVLSAFDSLTPAGPMTGPPLAPSLLALREPAASVGFVVGLVLLVVPSRMLRPGRGAREDRDRGGSTAPHVGVPSPRPAAWAPAVPGLALGTGAGVMAWLFGDTAVVGLVAGAVVGAIVLWAAARRPASPTALTDAPTAAWPRGEWTVLEAVRWASAIALVFGPALIARMAVLGW